MILLSLLGSTGSIGGSTLDVVRRWPSRFGVHSLVAGRNVKLLAQQIAEFRPKIAVVADEAALDDLLRQLKAEGTSIPELACGAEARIAAASAPEAGFVMSAIVGIEGLQATYEAVRLGKRIGLANKEVLVAAGALVTAAMRESGAEMIPVDSEHNGAHQCLRCGERKDAAKLILTASGGPFRETPVDALAVVTPEQALNHPTWKMGQRITIDSATLMNKGFEVIEACWLFNFHPSDVQVVVHPQSKVHAMVEFTDGSVIAQVSATDMRMPIQYALTYPERAEAPVPRLNWAEPSRWTFDPPDFKKFPLLKLAYQAQEAGGSATATLNAADEIAVEAFLAGRIPFPAIAATVAETLDRAPGRRPRTIGDVLEIDRASRLLAREVVASRWGGGVAQTETAARA
ncbi:MAG: 1-deoxy-D-xylulose-5-phosphate reductoisomerase [Bryobacterales bacterium]|nr:1-deoxy-D-xylulose-5-phosphate reductoisomerase [Bryobacterales bacterium]MBV9397722.1 1-deoxy-D-xylulose-5-phosphate reductoisomerase [Bryobacterales bacterium]